MRHSGSRHQTQRGRRFLGAAAALFLAVSGLLGLAGTARAAAPDWSDAALASLGYALSEAWTHGLSPDHYGDARQLLSQPPGTVRDRMADAVFLAYAHDLAFGRVDPRRLDPDWTAPVQDQDLHVWLQRAVSSERVYDALEALAPQDPGYQALRQELVYRLAMTQEPVLVPGGPTLGQGESGARVDALRSRLHQLGLLADISPRGTAFDQQLGTALMRFQARHNLAADGRLGESTLEQLNTAPGWRLAQLRANLERWRWLPQDLGERHIRVNIADYRLEAWSNGQVERVHAVMIGHQYSRTPVFSEDMVYLELNPVWYTPMGLGARWVRAFRTNPAYAMANGFRLVDLSTGRQVSASEADWANRRYRVVQRPGPGNSMGEVKFLFPNVHNVYIHDTPHRELFANVQRDESSGCIRVQDPVDLAWWIMQAMPGWTRARLDAVVATDRTQRVYLDTPLPVHILYFTAVADRFGEVRFVHDVYGRDAALVNALDNGLPALPDAPIDALR